MPAKLLCAAALLLFATACGLDLDDAPANQDPQALAPEPTIASASEAPDPDPAPATEPPPAGSLSPIATPAPTREPQPVQSPQGTTGLNFQRTEGVTYDETCIDHVNTGDNPELDARLESPYLADSPPLVAFTPIEFAPDPALQQALLAALGPDAGRYAYVVKDLATGYGAAHNPDRLFNAASLFKLFIMYEVFHQQALGYFEWDHQLVVTPYYDAFALSPRITELCQVMTVSEALSAMLTISDNAAAVLLQDLVGAGNVNNAIARLGLTDSGLFTDGLPVTAADLALLLEAIARGQAVGAEASADMLQLMAAEGIDNGIVAGLPGPATVAHKTGNWSDATHDADLVFTDFGVYVIVVLSETSHETRGIQALSSAAYQHFAGTTP